MKRVFREVWAVLQQEPERWLAYLHGQKLENMPHLIKSPPRHTGIVKRLLILLYFVFRNTRLVANGRIRADFFFYASTSNQISSLEGTLSVLRNRGQSVTAVSDFKDEGAFEFEPFSAYDLLVGLALTVLRLPAIWRQTRNTNPALREWYFDLLCRCPIYLVHFNRLLHRYQPRMVVVSNDHNPSNRCLLAMAHHLGIFTVYCQHASVSSLFPALRVNVALLDGSAALDTYKKCESNQPPGRVGAPRPHIFLSGQKKELPSDIDLKRAGIGLAVNALDDPDRVVALIYALKDYPLVLRWHPRQAHKQVVIFKEALSYTGHSFSDPAQEKVGSFLKGLRFLIASDSSIHLEAALAMVQPIYYRFASSGPYDYYGYVGAGIAKEASSLSELVRIFYDEPKCMNSDPDSPVRYYSFTFGTEWFGREAELAANILMSVPEETSYPSFSGYVGLL